MAFATDIQNTSIIEARPVSFLKAFFNRRKQAVRNDSTERKEKRERVFRKYFEQTRSNARVWL
ncbi:MAG: hypothetical protein OEZ19_05945 [Paracoccaceae bacterium]|nr:hypothetical protein [Paracoccaceae bacterium]